MPVNPETLSQPPRRRRRSAISQLVQAVAPAVSHGVTSQAPSLVGSVGSAVATGIHHPHAVASILSIPPPTPASTLLSVAAQRTGAAVIAAQRAAQAQQIQAQIQDQAAAIWKAANAHGPVPKVHVTPTDISRLAPQTNGVAVVGPRDARPRIYVSAQRAIALTSPKSQANKTAREALTAALGRTHAARVQRRRAAVRQAIAPFRGLGPDAAALAKADIRYGRKYDIPPSVLFNQQNIESGLGANTGPSSAGALGDSQFIPGTRQMILDKYGVDAYGSPAEAAHAQALLLRDSGYAQDPNAAVLAYNHSQAYVDQVLSGAAPYAALDKVRPGPLGSQASAAPQAPPRQRFLAHVDISPGLPTAADLGIKNGNLVIDNIHPELQRALIKLSKQTGIKPILNEGWRTASYQAHLAATVSGPVAAPGQSKHESGLAVDIDNHAAYTEAQLNAAGLGHFVANDPEHLQLVNEPAALVGPLAGQPAAGGAAPATGTTTPGAYSSDTTAQLAALGTGTSGLAQRRKRRSAPVSLTPIEAPISAAVPFAQTQFTAASDALSGGSSGLSGATPERQAQIEAIMRQAGLL